MKRINTEHGDFWREYQAVEDERVTFTDADGRATITVIGKPDGSIEVHGTSAKPAITIEPYSSNVVIVRMRDLG